MRNYSSGLMGIAMAFADRSRQKRELKQIRDANEANQGIIRYQPSQIEAFFTDADPFQNMIFSGGSEEIRNRAIARAIDVAYTHGYSVLVLHSGNAVLEQTLNSYFGSAYVCIVNRRNPIYDPFVGASENDISRLVLSSATKTCQINSLGRYYINGVTQFIKAKRINPYIRMYITCPHITLIDKVNDAEAKGQITANQARLITSQILQGEVERGSIEAFFAGLSRQADAILAQKKDTGIAINVNIAAKRNQILSIDVLSSTNSLLINLLVNETETILSQGGRMMIVVDEIPMASSDVLMDYIKRGGANISVIATGNDVYAGFGGADNDFFAFSGRSSKIIISKHTSAYSCQKFSDTIGSYDKQEISNAFASNVNYVSHWGYGSTKTSTVNIKRENIVKPEEIQRMEADEVYILDRVSGELSNSKII